MPYMVRDQIQLYYEIHGEGAPCIFLHGLGADHTQILQSMHRYPSIQMIVVDQRGHGKSSLDVNFNFAEMVEDIRALVTYLKLNHFFIGGISMGAAVSLAYALRYEESLLGLILVRPAWLDGPMRVELQSWFTFLGNHLALPDGKQRYQESEHYAILKRMHPRVASSFLQFFENPVARITSQKFIDIPKQQPIESLGVLTNLQVPTLVLANDQDPIHPLHYGEVLSQNIEQATYAQLVAKTVNEYEHNRQMSQKTRKFIKKQVKYWERLHKNDVML